MDATSIQAIVIAGASAFGSILSLIAIIAGVINKFNKVRSDIGRMTDTTNLNAALAEVHAENANLKREIVKLTKTVNKIYSEVQNKEVSNYGNKKQGNEKI